jgi:hypothetical protein
MNCFLCMLKCIGIIVGGMIGIVLFVGLAIAFSEMLVVFLSLTAFKVAGPVIFALTISVTIGAIVGWLECNI